jgi:hypothetical protein
MKRHRIAIRKSANEPQPYEDAAEVVTDCREDVVDGAAPATMIWQRALRSDTVPFQKARTSARMEAMWCYES